VLELIKSQRFQTEYQGYQTKIEKITDNNVKNQTTILLKTLVNEVRKLDNQHQEMFSGNQIPMGLSDVRSGIVSIRKKLDTLLKDWEHQVPKI
jgi:cell fate regulator YaaT (PSP1 superfamily)